MARWLRIAAVAAPALALAAIGLLHPRDLTPDTAALWRDLHVATLPLFPLLAVPDWLLLRRRSPGLAVVTGVLGGVFAVGYTALDVLAGIGAGALEDAGLRGEGVLFGWANTLALPATVALLVATALTAARLLPVRPALAVPGGVLAVAAAASFLTSHIYAPRGVATMVALAAGWALLAAIPGDAAAPSGARAALREDGVQATTAARRAPLAPEGRA